MTAQTLLIVDDDQAERDLTSRLARDTFPGARVEAVADALAAREACKQEQFDCVILDYNMPGMDGLACAQRLRATHPYLPIVMSTGYGDEMLAAHAVTSGVTDYIPKSRITAQSLTRVVENAIRITRQARVIDEQRNELENFAFALAHDFKQPIRQITTFANLVSEAIHAGRADEIAQHLDFLNGAARRLGSLVDVMSQYTLLGQKPAIGDVDLGEVLANVRAALGSYIEERGGRVIQDKAPRVRGNEALVAQVLQKPHRQRPQIQQQPGPDGTDHHRERGRPMRHPGQGQRHRHRAAICRGNLQAAGAAAHQDRIYRHRIGIDPGAQGACRDGRHHPVQHPERRRHRICRQAGARRVTARARLK